MTVNIIRLATGVPGLDKLIEGGYVQNSINLIAGTTGTGKTILCSQFLLDGARKGEPGLYITLEQNKDSISEDLIVFDWGEEFKNYVDRQFLIIDSETPTDFKELSDISTNLIKRFKIKRFVLDSLSVASMGWKISSSDIGKTRREMFGFMSTLKNSGVTSLLITEIPEGETKSLSRFGFEEFLADGIIILNYFEYTAGGIPRSLMIRKMRRTSFKNDILPLEIGDDGIKVLSTRK